jgi:hypothetical protein
MADPNQPVAHIFRRPRNRHNPQNSKNIKCPSFFLSLNPNSTTKDPIGFFSKPLTTPPRTLWFTWWLCFKTDSSPSRQTELVPISDLGELRWRSISWWVLKLVP